MLGLQPTMLVSCRSYGSPFQSPAQTTTPHFPSTPPPPSPAHGLLPRPLKCERKAPLPQTPGHRYRYTCTHTCTHTCTCILNDVCRPVAAGGDGSGNGGMAVRFGGRDRPSCCPGCQKVCHCLSCLTTHVLAMCSVNLQALSLCLKTVVMHSADMSIGLSG